MLCMSAEYIFAGTVCRTKCSLPQYGYTLLVGGEFRVPLPLVFGLGTVIGQILCFIST